MRQKIVTVICAIVLVVIIILLAQQMKSITTVPYLYYGSLSAKQMTRKYVITVSTMDRRNKAVHFSDEREVLKTKGIEPLKTEDWQNLVGRRMQDIVEQYGEPHADVGSGFYIPSYITEDAYLVLICLDEENVSEIIIEDLLPFEEQ